MLTDLYLEAHNKPSTLGREFLRICKENRGRIAFNDSTGHRVSYRKALLGPSRLVYTCPGSVGTLP